jgi:hypothetical protein
MQKCECCRGEGGCSYECMCYINVVRTAKCCHYCLSSTKQLLIHHFSYTKVYCLTHILTRFGAPRSHPQEGLSYLLNVPINQMVINNCPTVCCRNAVFTRIQNLYKLRAYVLLNVSLNTVFFRIFLHKN